MSYLPMPPAQRLRLPLPHSVGYRSRPTARSHPPHAPRHALGAAALAALLGVFAPLSASAATAAAPQLVLGWTLDAAAPVAWTALSTATTVATTSALAFTTGGASSASLWLRAANAGTAALPAAALSFYIAPASVGTAPVNSGWRRRSHSRSLRCAVAGDTARLSVPALAAGAQLGIRSDCQLPTLAAGDYQVWACARSSKRRWRWRRRAANCSERIALTVRQGPEPNLRASLHWLAATTTTTTATLTLATGSAAGLSLVVAVDNIGTAAASSTSLSYRLARLRTYTRPWWRGGGTVTRLSRFRHLACDAVAAPTLAAGARFSATALCSLPPGLATGDYQVLACVAAVPWERQRADNCAARLSLLVVEGTRPDLRFQTLHWDAAATDSTATLTLMAGSTATLSLSLSVASTGTATAAASSLSYHIAPAFLHTRPRRGIVYPALHSIHLHSCDVVSVPSLSPGASFSALASCALPARLAAGNYLVWACVAAVPWERQRTDNCAARLSLSVVEGARPDLRLEAYWAATGAPAADALWRPASTATTIAVATSTPVVSSDATATVSLWLAAENIGAALAAPTQLHYFIAPTGARGWHRWQWPWRRALALQRRGWHRSRHGGHGNSARLGWQAAAPSAARRQRLDCGGAELPTLAAGAGLLARRDCQLPTGLAVGSYRVWACLQAVPWEQRRVDNCTTALPLQLVAVAATTAPTASTGATTVTPIVGTGVAQLGLSLGWRTDGSAATAAWRVLAATEALSSTASPTLTLVAADGSAQSLPLWVVWANTGSAAAVPGAIKYYLSGAFWQPQLHSDRSRRHSFRRRWGFIAPTKIEGYSWVRRSVALDCGAAAAPSLPAGQRLLGQVDCALPTGAATGASYRLWACAAAGAGESIRQRKCSQILSLARPAVTSALRLSLSGPTALTAPTLGVQLSVENTGTEATTSATLSYYLAYRAGWWRLLNCGGAAATVPPLAAGAVRSWQQDCALPSLRAGDYQLKVCLDPATTTARAPKGNCQSLALRADAALSASEQPSTGGDSGLVGTLDGGQPTAPTSPPEALATITDTGRLASAPSVASANPQRRSPPANFPRRLRVVASAAAQEIHLPAVMLHGDAPQYPVELPFTVSVPVNAPSGADGHTVLPSSGVLSIASGRRGEIILQLPANYASLDGNPVVLVFAFAASGARNAVVGHADRLRVTIHPAATNLRPKLLHLARDGVAGMQLRQPADSTPSRAVEQSATPVALTVRSRDPNGDAISFQWSLHGPLPSRSILFSGHSTGTSSDDAWVARFSFNPQALVLGQRYLNQVRIDDGRGGAITVRRRFHVVAAGSTATHRHDSDGNGIGDSHQHHHLHHLLQGTAAASTRHVLRAESGLSIALGEHSEQAYQRRGEAPSAALPSDDALLGSVGASGHAFGDTGGVYDFELRGVEQTESGAGGEALVVLPQRVPIPAAAVYLKYSDGRWRPFDAAAGALHSAALGDDGACPSPDDASAYQPGLTAGHHCVRLTLVDGGANDADGEVNGTVADPGGIAVSVAVDTLTPSSGGGGAAGLLAALGLLLLLGLSLARVRGGRRPAF